jgi:NIPSNAP protein
MNRRRMLAALGTTALLNAEDPKEVSVSYLELKVWQLHNTPENQSERVAAYLQNGLAPALARTGAKLAGVFSTVIGPESPCLYSLIRYSSLGAMQQALDAMKGDTQHSQELEKLGSGPGLPFVRVESSLLRSFDVMRQPEISAGSPRVFELRRYESQSFATLTRKVGMFNDGEAKIFERLGFRPVFFGETIVGSKLPNLQYMLSYENLAARDRLWKSFINDLEWKKLSSQPELKDPQVVANITNVILAPLEFSAIR